MLWVDTGNGVRRLPAIPKDLLPVAEKLGGRASAGTPAEAANFGEGRDVDGSHQGCALARDFAPSVVGKVALDTGKDYSHRATLGLSSIFDDHPTPPPESSYLLPAFHGSRNGPTLGCSSTTLARPL